MAGRINSLGLGSGVLTSDLLDKLRGADEANIIRPFDAKIALNTQKGQALDLLNSLLTTYKGSVSALGNDTLYQKRSIAGSNDGVSATTVAGTQVQDFSINITNIAKKNVLESAAYVSSTASVANGSGTLNLGIGSKNYSINYTAATTLSDLKQSITDTAGADVTASVLQTGTSAFKLIITSKSTGLAQTISLSDTTKDTNGVSVASQLKDSNLITSSARTGTFAAESTAIATGSGTLNVNIGTTTVPLAYTATTKLSDLVSSINADTTLNTKVTASIVQFGTGDYRMVLTPKSGVSNSITITDSNTGLKAGITSTAAVAGSMGIVQDAKNANFTYDGISMSRSTNTITDISYGTTINLLKDAGSANISITQDRTQIAAEMEGMVKNYNALMTQMDDMTKYDAAAGKVGIFNGDNTIKSISREITKIITSFNTSGYSLPQYGISLDKSGVMSFDKAAFTAKLDADPTGTEKYFSGKASKNNATANSATTIDGVFTSLNNLFTSYTSSTGLLSNLTNASKTASTALNEERAKANKLLTTRYETLQAKFAAYDSIISKLNSQFSSLKQQINAEANAK